MAKAARDGGQRRRAAFRALRVAKGYDIWRKRTRERRRSSPRGCGVRSCGGRGKSMVTGGEESRAPVDESLRGFSWLTAPPNRLTRDLRRCPEG
jgi:hypothetical protein